MRIFKLDDGISEVVFQVQLAVIELTINVMQKWRPVSTYFREDATNKSTMLPTALGMQLILGIMT